MRALFLFVLAGCADDLPSRSGIERLRVLAVRAESPEIPPNGSTHVDLLAAAPNPIDLSVGWRACADPPGGDPLRCIDRPGTWGLPPVSETLLDLDLVAPVSSGTTIGLVALACAGALDDVDGERMPLCDGEQEIAVKRVAVSDPPTNHNPAFERVSIGGVDLPAERDGISFSACDEPCPRYAIVVDTTDDSAETIPGAGRRESIVLAVASDAGTLEPAFDDEAPFETFFTPPVGDGTTTVHLVLHDERGGVAWREVLVETR